MTTETLLFIALAVITAISIATFIVAQTASYKANQAWMYGIENHNRLQTLYGLLTDDEDNSLILRHYGKILEFLQKIFNHLDINEILIRNTKDTITNISKDQLKFVIENSKWSTKYLEILKLFYEDFDILNKRLVRFMILDCTKEPVADKMDEFAKELQTNSSSNVAVFDFKEFLKVLSDFLTNNDEKEEEIEKKQPLKPLEEMKDEIDGIVKLDPEPSEKNPDKPNKFDSELKYTVVEYIDGDIKGKRCYTKYQKKYKIGEKIYKGTRLVIGHYANITEAEKVCHETNKVEQETNS